MTTDRGRRPTPRKDHAAHALRPESKDPYRRDRKPGGALRCSRCGVAFFRGKWTWTPPADAELHEGLCPACERIRDREPAGTVRVHAPLAVAREELVQIARHVEEAEKDEHPLERLLAIDETQDGGLTVTTTGVHLARWITNKLERRLHLQAKIVYPNGEARFEAEIGG